MNIRFAAERIEQVRVLGGQRDLGDLSVADPVHDSRVEGVELMGDAPKMFSSMKTPPKVPPWTIGARVHAIREHRRASATSLSLMFHVAVMSSWVSPAAIASAIAETRNRRPRIVGSPKPYSGSSTTL